MRIQMIQRAVRLVAPFIAAQVQPLDLIEFPPRAFLVDRARRRLFVRMAEQAHLVRRGVGERRTVNSAAARARPTL